MMDLIDKGQTTGDYASAQFPVFVLGAVWVLFVFYPAVLPSIMPAMTLLALRLVSAKKWL